MKIIVVGNSGSGKTGLAQQQSSTIDGSIVHLDDLFWERGFNKKRRLETIELLIQSCFYGKS